MVRDNALSAAGLLALKMGGPSVRPYQPPGLFPEKDEERLPLPEYVISPGPDRYRRGVYIQLQRSVPYPSLITFDATPRVTCTLKRARSNTPMQALTLLNDPVYVEAAKALACRVLIEQPNASIEQRIAHAFRLCTGRVPRDGEVAVLRQLFEGQCDSARSDPAAARELVGDWPLPAGVGVEEFTGWFAVATALLNLDEMITKG
jgi:hypothetical protein